MAALASRTGQAHIALRVGRVLLSLEDREALDAVRRAVRKAEALAEAVYGPVEDGFIRAESRARREFEGPAQAAQLSTTCGAAIAGR